MKQRRTRLILYIVILLIVGIQFLPVDRSVQATDPEDDFLMAMNPPARIAGIIEQACYDCHSNNTEYPWYAYIQPVSGWIQGHIDHAREHLNFSEWETYDAEKSDHKLEEASEEVEEGHMPLPSFTWLHPEARLTDQEREELADWFESLRN